MRMVRVRPQAQLLKTKKKGDSGYDLTACNELPVTIPNLSVYKIPLGIVIELPDGEDYEAQVRSRSGLTGDGIIAQLGTVDSNFRGELAVVLVNLSGSSFVVKPGDRIAQLVITYVARVHWVEAESVEELTKTDRGANGWGSSGLRSD